MESYESLEEMGFDSAGISSFEVNYAEASLTCVVDYVWVKQRDELRAGNLTCRSGSLRYVASSFDSPHTLYDNLLDSFNEVRPPDSGLVTLDQGTTQMHEQGPAIRIGRGFEHIAGNVRHFQLASNTLNAEWLCNEMTIELEFITPQEDWWRPDEYNGPLLPASDKHPP